jgi:transcription antitermination protein NusB
VTLNKLDKIAIKGKRRARKIALQALYQRLVSGLELSEIEAQFRAIHADDKIDFDYFCRLLYGIQEAEKRLDDAITPFLDRPIESLNPIELVVLRLGAFELLDVLELPYRVVLDESVNLAKTFGSQDGHRYVNGVLNNLARHVRSVEID